MKNKEYGLLVSMSSDFIADQNMIHQPASVPVRVIDTDAQRCEYSEIFMLRIQNYKRNQIQRQTMTRSQFYLKDDFASIRGKVKGLSIGQSARQQEVRPARGHARLTNGGHKDSISYHCSHIRVNAAGHRNNRKINNLIKCSSDVAIFYQSSYRYS
jgi:hypothetical protein